MRLALVGGPPGLAERAGEVLSEAVPVQLVHTDHGCHDDWSTPLSELAAAAPDVTLCRMPMLWAWSKTRRR